MSVNETEHSSMDKFYKQTIDALVAAAGERDSIAQGHSERVRKYSISIASKMGCMTDEELKNLEYAASLHDIGKVAISSKILNKLGRLTDEEFTVMRQHSLIATRILAKIDGLSDAIPIIKHHHEHFDGNGYPDGLAGDDIPLGARIVAVAETYDILTSDVPWRDALSPQAAMHEMNRCSGTQFDPKCIEVLSSILEELNKAAA